MLDGRPIELRCIALGARIPIVGINLAIPGQTSLHDGEMEILPARGRRGEFVTDKIRDYARPKYAVSAPYVCCYFQLDSLSVKSLFAPSKSAQRRCKEKVTCVFFRFFSSPASQL